MRYDRRNEEDGRGTDQAGKKNQKPEPNNENVRKEALMEEEDQKSFQPMGNAGSIALMNQMLKEAIELSTETNVRFENLAKLDEILNEIQKIKTEE